MGVASIRGKQNEADLQRQLRWDSQGIAEQKTREESLLGGAGDSNRLTRSGVLTPASYQAKEAVGVVLGVIGDELQKVTK